MVYENSRGGDSGGERGGKGGGGDRAPYRRGKKPNPLTAAKVETVDFKDVTLLKYFVTERGKIIPRRITGVTSKQQRQIAQSVKRARVLGLLPFVRLEG